ncbi:hypothetical protein ACHAXT_008084 [Thalassiosira profunda]
MSGAGWARVAQGLSRVAAEGASRIPSAAATSNVVNKHLPELGGAVAKAAANNAAAMQSSLDAIQEAARNHRHSGGSGQAGGEYHQPSSHMHTPFDGPADVANRDGSGSTIANDASINIEISGSLGKRPKSSLDKESATTIVAHRDAESAQPQHANIGTGTKQPILDDQSTASYSEDHQIESYSEEHQAQHLPEGTAVPSTRISRAFGFASLGAGLAMGTAAEMARRVVGSSDSNDSGNIVLSNDANAQRLSTSLRRMRGAAMKLGQMLSIQDESIAPPALTNALAQVRKGAEAMPMHQLTQQLEDQWGEGWREKIDLEERPFAAASIGQVHRGKLLSPDGATSKVAVKVQYPGVADSIESDLSNLSMLVKATGLAPPGLFLDNVIRVGRDELKVECDYRREAEHQKRFQSLIASDPSLVADRVMVPDVVDELSTDRILVTELVHGGTIDKVVNLDQSERNRIGRAIMRLTMLELFVWRFMQTDPNWGNFLYDVRTRTTYLIDFGAAREYDKEFVRGYLNIVVANANRDEERLMKESIRMGFLTGEESDVMKEAHKLSGFCLGEPFRSDEPYDFRTSRITSRISEHGAVFLRHRLTPPPEEVYTLHRKLAGAYNLCIKLGANISCRDLLDEVVAFWDAKETTTTNK